MAVGPVLFAALAVAGAAAMAQQPAQARRTDDIHGRRIVYSVPGMDRVRVRRNVTYRTVDGAALPMDAYSPPGVSETARRPTVILIHGGPISPEASPTEWGVYRSYGELIAASGFVGISFKHRLNRLADFPRAAGDVSALIDYVRGNAGTLQVDPDRLALWAFSAGGAFLSVAFQDPRPAYVRCVVSYYAILDVREPAGSEVSIPESAAPQLSPAYLVARNDGPFPQTLIARPALDNPRINQSVDDFLRAAVLKDLSVDLLTLPRARHGFDVLDDDDRSREVIESTIGFLKRHLGAR